MALGTGQITTTTGAKFLPELWSDDIAARYKVATVLANLVTNWDHTGKPGELVHVPSPTRTSASNIYSSQGSALSFSASTENEFTITINQHWAVGKQIPDVVAKQLLGSYRRFLTDDLGYSLAVAVDSYLWTTARLFRGASQDAGVVIAGDGKTAWNASANTNTGNGTAITDAGIRQMIQTLDDIDVPGMNRYLVIPPVAKNTLLGLARFTEQAYTGERGADNSIRNGRVGDVYGVEVYVSTNSPTVAATDTTTNYRLATMLHKDSMILATQIAPRVQSQYKVEYLSDVLVADTAFGAAVVRSANSASYDRGVTAILPA